MENRLARLEAVQSMLLEIGQLSTSCSDITGFVRAVHGALGRIMYAANFYVALSEDDGSVRFVYFIDELDEAPSPYQKVALASPDQSPTAYVMLTGTALVATRADFIARESEGMAWGGGSPAEHWMGCPLLDQDHQALGAMVIQSYSTDHTYSAEDQALFALIANHVSAALQGLRSMDRLEGAVQERTARLAHEVAERRRAEQVQHALYEIANLSASALDTEELPRALHGIIGELMVAENFLVRLYQPEKDEFSIPYFVDQQDDEAPDLRFSYSKAMCSYVLATKQAQLHDAGSFARLIASGQVPESPLGNVGIASWMGAPMLMNDLPYGIIIVQSYDPAILYTKTDLDLLAFVASHVAVALARMQAGQYIRKTKDRLEQQNAALNAALTALREAQSELVRQEKLASLGALVAGVAHEINTPLGICVTATSHLVQELKLTREELAAGAMTEDSLDSFLDIVDQSLRIMTTNTQRAAALVRSFKQVAVDQSSGDIRSFNLGEYLHEVLLSLQPKLKGRPVRVQVECAPDLVLESYPGAVSQIVTNMVMNSLIHGFAEEQAGRIAIRAALEGDMVTLEYADDGAGMEPRTLAKLFEPFFTTRRGNGGSGLGAHILYNLVTGALAGTVRVESAPGQGLRYHLKFPRNLKVEKVAA
jgi:signal transduction histidine kinase